VPGNAEIVRRSYEVWNSGDLDSFLEFLSPDLEMDLTERVLNPGSYRGVEGFRQWAAELSEVWKEWTMEPEDIVEAGDRSSSPSVREGAAGAAESRSSSSATP
jgi:ketosteroid isomerase-like protein